MPPSDFATADIDKVLNDLLTDEAILLTAGVGFWYTHLSVLVYHWQLSRYSFILHILFDRLITLTSSLAMVQMVYEEKTSLWACLPVQSVQVCQ